MSRLGSDLYEPRHRFRVVFGPLFGLACLLATLTGVVVLSVLLGSLIARVLQRPPSAPWYDLPGHVRELFAFLYALVTQSRSRNPAIAGFRDRVCVTSA